MIGMSCCDGVMEEEEEEEDDEWIGCCGIYFYFGYEMDDLYCVYVIVLKYC